jgi:dihydroxyacid dehydratase/phosphogluconate dehydratase
MTLPGAASIPAVDANHQRMADQVRPPHRGDGAGRTCGPRSMQTREAFLNGITVAMALGCSTNAIIHVIAQARRAGAGHRAGDDFDRISREVPVLANIRPNGSSQYLMEDFYYAGGLPALMQLACGPSCTWTMTVTGKTVGENIEGAECFNDDVIRPLANPVYAEGSLAVLRGNLAPDGCVIKPSAMSEKFLRHTGPALVFDDYPSLKKMLDDPRCGRHRGPRDRAAQRRPKGGPACPSGE